MGNISYNWIILRVSVARFSHVVLVVKNTPDNAGDKIDAVSIPQLAKFPGQRNGTNSCILAKKKYGQRSLEGYDP